ncbi:hypothetical protein MLD38_025069 [Melastoma candidum]|uniref:Uncharacterized protein n=1 Tax=Melastoma candidum TaxID=119954 RepID=A0ACB9NUN5_9MYRT|nr:hypothetical protein MLD38_025069 [Melastoma candidum]
MAAAAAAANARADCRGMYSWWWDSHISPKNSKWFCENLKDMDVKVKQMIRIIEEDADSFAKRAEMYYKRRPELMKLAEDFYRAYRALAERYGHATGVLRHARRTMAEAFPDKVKSMWENGRDSAKYGEDSDDFPPERSDYDIAAVMGLPEEFMSPEMKSGFDELGDLFGSLGAGKSCLYSCSCDEGFPRAITCTEEAKTGGESETWETEVKGLPLAEKPNHNLLSGLEYLTLQVQDAEISEKQKELGRLQHADVDDSLQKLKNIWFQFQEETTSLLARLQGKVRLLEDEESGIEHLQEELRKVHEENTVWHLEMEIPSGRERLQKLEADSDQLACILEDVHSVGLDPENLVPTVKELHAQLAETKKTLEQERSEHATLQEKSALLDEYIEKNVLLEISVFYLETQLDEFRDKIQFLEKSCESLLDERSNAALESDSLTTRLQEAAEQNKKLKDMNRRLETSLSEANSQLRALMLRAKGINDYPQNAEKDYEELRRKYSVLETEKEVLKSEITRLQIELKRKEECEEELEKSLDANINGLLPNRGARDAGERNSSLLFKFQTLAEAWKFLQVQISCLEHENLVQQSELQFLSDEIDAGKATLHAMSKLKTISPTESVKLDHDDTKNVMQKVHDWRESLSKIEEEYLEWGIEKSVLCSSLLQMKQEAADAMSDLNKLKIENRHLRSEIADVKSENEVLLCETLCGKDLLCEKENRILEAEKLLKAIDCEDKKVQRKLYNLKMELANAKLGKEDQEKQISRLSDNLNQQIVESGCLREQIKLMERQLLDVKEEYREVSRKKQSRADESQVREAQSTAVLCEFIMSGLKFAMLEDSVFEAAIAQGKENDIRLAEITRLMQMVKTLEGENVELRSRVDAFTSVIEKVTTVSEWRDRKCRTGTEAEDEEVADKVAFYEPDLKISFSQNEFTTKEIVVDQSSGFLHFSDNRSSGVEADDRMLELWETSDASGNIDLKVGKPLRVSRPDDLKSDDTQKDHKDPNCPGESRDDKKHVTDKQEIIENITEHKQVGSKRRLLERLNADAQKLTNLHITLNDLQRMVELIVWSEQQRGGEYDTIKSQLDEARATTAKLSQANTKLVKAVEKRFRSRHVKPTSEAPDDGESFIRRRISEKARRGTEKVARLQSEAQKLQFLLLRLSEQKEEKARATAKAVDRKPRVLLKDYLNSRSRSSSGGGSQKQKAQFCACVQLPSRRI